MQTRKPVRCFDGNAEPYAPFWNFKDSADGVELEMYGPISEYSWMDDEITPKKFKDDLYARGGGAPVTIKLNSPGGDVFAASVINAILSDYFPQSELDLIDMTLRMYTQPVLSVDDALLIGRLEEIKQEKSELLRGLMDKLGAATEEDVRKKLASNPQFATVLKELGIEPPMKTSPTTGKQTFALAKNDEGFIALQESDNP